jgi:TolB-like protein
MSDSPSTRAVFLSYAREDSEAARRIAEALRGFGVDVWFDQSELRGGDAWDAKIKRQIRECALFIAVISANSQARGEGYFRREWKLAIERTHDMAAGIPFLIPVVIDQTLEAKALVPEEFMRVQWTRLVGGAPTPQFVERVTRLVQDPAPQVEATPGRMATRGGVPTGSFRGPGIPGWLWGVIGGSAVAAAAFVALSHRAAPPAPEPKAAAAAPAPSLAPVQMVPSEKSIAVLPFANMSEEKDNEFFTDGIQEDILTNLALVHELRVVSRTSVLRYKDTSKSIGQIASELGVAYILEGSVRREGNKVRVTGQLIRAATDEHVWAKSYDRDLTDIFAIQSELSQAIAEELKAALSPEEKVMLDRKPTENSEAYDLYLKARSITDEFDDPERLKLFERAVALDPSFARAWGDLADGYAFSAFNFTEGMAESLAKAKVAIGHAVQLAPEDPDVIGSLGTYYYYGFRDYSRANEQYQRLAGQRPNDAGVFNSLGLIQRRQGKWAESLANLRRATELDVSNAVFLRNLIVSLYAGRRYDELREARRRMVSLKPDDLLEAFFLTRTSFHASGSTQEVEAFLAGLTPEQLNSPEGFEIRAVWADSLGDVRELIRIDKLHPHFKRSQLAPWEEDVLAAQNLYMTGDRTGALARLGRVPGDLAERLRREPANPRLYGFDAIVEMIQGHREAALRAVAHTVELTPASLDALTGPWYAGLSARALDYLGEKDRAIAEYARLLKTPGSELNVYDLKHDTRSTLRGDPRFEALLDDPANNAPLF